MVAMAARRAAVRSGQRPRRGRRLRTRRGRRLRPAGPPGCTRPRAREHAGGVSKGARDRRHHAGDRSRDDPRRRAGARARPASEPRSGARSRRQVAGAARSGDPRVDARGGPPLRRRTSEPGEPLRVAVARAAARGRGAHADPAATVRAAARRRAAGPTEPGDQGHAEHRRGRAGPGELRSRGGRRDPGGGVRRSRDAPVLRLAHAGRGAEDRPGDTHRVPHDRFEGHEHGRTGA